MIKGNMELVDGSAAVGGGIAAGLDGGGIAAGTGIDVDGGADDGAGADVDAGASAVALLEEVELYGNVEVAPNVGMLVLRAPQIAARVCPGQFIHLCLGGLPERLLRRPFSVLDADRTEGIIWILYQAVGEGTRWLYARVQKPLDEKTVERLDPLAWGKLDAIGPLGQGWSVPQDARRVLLVAGGIGLAPLQMLAAECAQRALHIEVALGAQRAEMLLCTKPFIESVTEENLHVVTDDGSLGRKGFVTDVARELLQHDAFDYVATCGPEPMQRIVAELAAAAGVPCEVSLERRMACGVGACLSCAVNTTRGSKRACVDGPVFDAREVLW